MNRIDCIAKFERKVNDLTHYPVDIDRSNIKFATLGDTLDYIIDNNYEDITPDLLDEVEEKIDEIWGCVCDEDIDKYEMEEVVKDYGVKNAIDLVKDTCGDCELENLFETMANHIRMECADKEVDVLKQKIEEIRTLIGAGDDLS